ncbi:MAG: CehA/McbA family metallohydrolase [Terracidiphilus sp.]
MTRPYKTLPARIAVLFLLVLSTVLTHSQTPAEPPAPAPNVVLHGIVHGSQNHSYIKVPFHVPAGVHRVTLTFTYTEKDQHTALDLGLLDPVSLRCWSGGNKSVLTVALTDATPSCLPGAIPAGTWNVLIGVPNIRPQVTSRFTAQVFFTRTGLVADYPEVLREPLRAGPGWFRGDLHMHTAHSDGQCPSQTGKMVPCPLYFTVDAAARRGLDFIAITDHNAQSQYDAMRELEPYFDKVLLIPGREITTFYGHLNFLGTTQFLDFRLGTPAVPTVNDLLRSARKLGALISINHPLAPTGEICMGCGWNPNPPADMSLLDAVEAANGGSEATMYSGATFWEHQLDLGYRLTAIGGSDNHRPMRPLDRMGSIGSPTTVVYAANLSTPAILAGIRSGRVFIDITGSKDRTIGLTATCAGETAHMGGLLQAANGAPVSFDAQVVDAAGAKVEFIEDGKPLEGQAPSPVSSAVSQTFHANWTSDGQRHWFLAQAVGPGGKNWLLGNPVYVNWKQDR